jgi:predicted kinase
MLMLRNHSVTLRYTTRRVGGMFRKHPRVAYGNPPRIAIYCRRGANPPSPEGATDVTTLTVLIGPAGAGKSTYAATRWWPGQVVSSDQLRLLLTGDSGEQEANNKVFALLHDIVRERLGARVDTVVDATNSRACHRAALLEIARDCDAVTVAVVLNTPLRECRIRNASRSRRVPPDVIEAQHQRIQADLPGLLGEGFMIVDEVAS